MQKIINLKNWTAVLVADRIESHENESIENRKFEFIDDKYFHDIEGVLQLLCKSVIHIEDPKILSELEVKKETFVFSVWSGVESRNRRAIVPSICEAKKIPYIGGDAYTNIVCQDKDITKSFVKKFNLSVPNGLLIENESQLDSIRILKNPLVVKPNLEGGSIGISCKNLVESYETAISLAKKLLKSFEQPILIEEFVPGREVNIIVSGSDGKIDYLEAIEIYFQDNPKLLIEKIWGYELKKTVKKMKSYRIVTDEISKEEISNIESLFNNLGKVDILRIDGRLSNGIFTVVELTPDIHMGKLGSFAQAHILSGITYEKMMEGIISNTLMNL